MFSTTRKLLPFLLFVLAPALLPAQEDCIAFNTSNVKSAQIKGDWKVVDGDNWLLSFGVCSDCAKLAANVIHDYKMTQLCFIGRDTPYKMMYFRTATGFPAGPMRGENATRLIPAQVRVDLIKGHNWLMSPTHKLVDFGPNRDNGVKAMKLIKDNNLSWMVGIGHGSESMLYFLVDAKGNLTGKVKKMPPMKLQKKTLNL